MLLEIQYLSAKMLKYILSFLVLCGIGIYADNLIPALPEAKALLDEKSIQKRLEVFLNSSQGAGLKEMMKRVEAMKPEEIKALINETFSNNSTALRQAKQFGFGFGGFGGGFGGGNSLLLALLLRDRHRDHDWPRPMPQQNNQPDFASLATLTLLGIALISRFPTQGYLMQRKTFGILGIVAVTFLIVIMSYAISTRRLTSSQGSGLLWHLIREHEEPSAYSVSASQKSKMGYAVFGSIACCLLILLCWCCTSPVAGRSLAPDSNDPLQNTINHHQARNNSDHKHRFKLPPAYRQTLKRLLKLLMKNGTLQLPEGFNLANVTAQLANVTGDVRSGRQFGGGNGDNSALIAALLLLDDDDDGFGGDDDWGYGGYGGGGGGGGGSGGSSGGGDDMSQMLPFLLLGLALLAQSPTQG
ncbi:uncharacterized protein LOC129580764 [Paramacrobiotus metropolitanus]|uniref:uncharacterized protein LOC129580764 n=1 Tax=Paramacrobiotus metropolitanus TaxID=2943436 RepID=UPI002445D02B|nr:uncharacterized protein LOC129580764 [Paramacrobiotus metropolitanus]